MSPEFTTTDKLTDEALDHGAGGSIRTTRFETVRYWVGHETGDVFGRDCDYDGLTLTIEVADAADAQAMLDAISGDAFRRGVEVGWDERLKQERNNAEVAAHRRASQAAPAPSDALREAAQSFVPLYCKGIPADCCDYAVVSLAKQREVCRVWDEADARLIASLLNRAALSTPTEEPK